MVGRRLACDWMMVDGERWKVDDGDWRFKVDPAHQSSNQHPSNLQMFSTYRRVNQVRYLASKPLIIKGTTQYGCKPMVLIKMVVVVLDKCGWRSIELLARIRIMRSMQFMH